MTNKKQLIEAIIEKFNKDGENYSVFFNDDKNQFNIWDEGIMGTFGSFGGTELISALYSVQISCYLSYSVSINKVELIIAL